MIKQLNYQISHAGHILPPSKTREIKAACKLFFIKRGLPANYTFDKPDYKRQ